ncbi:hypothetical protein [Brevundimonas sp. NIBR10]|uniref:hypothetical protein n=1 Tax=Brevundimonas sp. NIBR10 TaxID=3015997 RepID=UPI0022F1DA3A|nr:hypothetical protein [Brevundimonas sp. NIBR10]
MADPYAFDSLLAEREAAYWAAVSAFATVFGLFVNVAAVGGLMWQLRQNRRAIEASTLSAGAAAEAVRITRAEVRPWIKLEVFEPTNVDFQANGQTMLRVPYRLTNVGSLVALNVRFWPVQCDYHQTDEMRAMLLQERTNLHGDTMFPAEVRPSESIMVAIRDFNGRPQLLGRVFYRVPGESFDRRTCVMIWGCVPENPAFWGQPSWPVLLTTTLPEMPEEPIT